MREKLDEWLVRLIAGTNPRTIVLSVFVTVVAATLFILLAGLGQAGQLDPRLPFATNVLIVLATIMYAGFNLLILFEMRESRQRAAAPDIAAWFEASGPGHARFRLQNVGNATALNISIGLEGVPWNVFGKHMGLMLVGQVTPLEVPTTALNAVLHRPPGSGKPQPGELSGGKVRISAHYRNPFGEGFTATTELPFLSDETFGEPEFHWVGESQKFLIRIFGSKTEIIPLRRR